MGRAPRLVLRGTVREAMIQAATNALPVETGGILLGYREDADIVVTDLIVVPNPSATSHRYTRDDVEANVRLRDWLLNHPQDPLTGYVGEWHSHTGLGPVSGLDLSSARATARKAKGGIALVVCSPRPLIWLDAFVLQRRRLRRVSAEQVSIQVQHDAMTSQPPLPKGAVRSDGPVFISYRQSDGSQRATVLEHLLRSAGLVVWRDRNDLRAGNTSDRLDQALTGGLSGAVLVVTEDIKNSDVVRERELPRLLQLDEDPDFSFCVANEIPHPDNDSRPDFDAPDRLLQRADAALKNKKQSDGRTEAGRLEIVRDLVMHRIELRRDAIEERNSVLTVLTQTRPEPYAIDALSDVDLHIRLGSAEHGRLPGAGGLSDLKQTLPVIADAIFASRAQTVRIAGGMHLSVALAIGAALPETRLGDIEVVDLRANVWSSRPSTDPVAHALTIEAIEAPAPTDASTRQRVGALVTLTPNADQAAFRQLLDTTPGGFGRAVRIAVEPETMLEPRDAARISAEVAGHLKRLSAEANRAEVHLAFQGPYGMAVLVGRLLNTLRVVVYEWEDHEELGPTYRPVLTLEPGVSSGPITSVLV